MKKRPWLLTIGVLVLGVATIMVSFPTVQHRVTHIFLGGGDTPHGKSKQPP